MAEKETVCFNQQWKHFSSGLDFLIPLDTAMIMIADTEKSENPAKSPTMLFKGGLDVSLRLKAPFALLK